MPGNKNQLCVGLGRLFLWILYRWENPAGERRFTKTGAVKRENNVQVSHKVPEISPAGHLRWDGFVDRIEFFRLKRAKKEKIRI